MAAAVLTAAASGCGADSGRAAGDAASSAPKGGAASAAPKAARPENGVQLGRLLPTQAELPPGWTYNASEGTGEEVDTGSALLGPPYFAVLPRMSCSKAKGVDADFLVIDYQASDAQIEVWTGHGKNQDFANIILASYYPGWAVKEFGLISSFAFHRCGPFEKKDEVTAALVKMKPTVTAVFGLGDQALLMKTVQVNGPLPDGYYYPGDYLLVFRVGNYIAEVDAPEIPGQPEAQAVDAVAALLGRKLRQIS